MSEPTLPRPERDPPQGARLVLSWVWALSPTWSIGFLTAPVMVYAGVRHRHVANWLLAAVYVACTVVMMVTAGAPDDSSTDNLFEAALAVNMFAATGHALVIRSRVFSRPQPREPGVLDAQQAALVNAEEQAQAREVARALVAEDPNRAVYLRIGRIDQPGREFPDGGLIDVNNVSRYTLKTMVTPLEPYLDHLVEVRERIRGFESVDDLSVAVGLPPHLLDHLTDRLVFLPRYEHGAAN